jgi:hypothetical protein
MIGRQGEGWERLDMSSFLVVNISKLSRFMLTSHFLGKSCLLFLLSTAMLGHSIYQRRMNLYFIIYQLIYKTSMDCFD